MGMDRDQLRKNLRALRQHFSSAHQLHAAQKILEHLLNQPEWQTAQHIGVYYAFDNEVPTTTLIEKIWQSGKHVYLPLVQSDNSLRFAAYDPDTPLKQNRFGISEPDSSYFFPAEELDIVIVPLVGFDQHGNRLGTGAGYYDRTFAFLNTPSRPKKPMLIGFAYEQQKVDTIEVWDWDVKLDRVITEEGIVIAKE